MKFGFDQNNKFFVEYESCTRPPGTLRQESQVRAREIYSKNNKVILCLSSGLDSQIALHSFKSQDIPITCAFLRMGGYNDNELENLRILEKKWSFKAEIVEINPNNVREEIEFLKGELDVHANHCIQHMFVKQLPEEYDIVQVLHDPWIMTRKQTNQHYIFHSYYDPEIARYRALDAIDRTGKIVMFGDSSEYFLSSIGDELFSYFLKSWIYYDENGLLQYGFKLNDVLRYEYYIKPMLYAKNWGNELLYFPKFSGYENIDWLFKEVRYVRREKMCFAEYGQLLAHLRCMNGLTKRFNEISTL